MQKIYAFSDYDKHLSLKLNIDLWLIIAYFMRPFILKISTIQIGFGTKSESVKGLKEFVYPDDFGFFLAFLATLPVILVVIAYMKRKPDAKAYIRTFWRNSGKLLVLTAILNIVIVFLPYFVSTAYQVNSMGWGQVAIAAYIIFYLLTSRRVKDTFADFPADTEVDEEDTKVDEEKE